MTDKNRFEITFHFNQKKKKIPEVSKEVRGCPADPEYPGLGIIKTRHTYTNNYRRRKKPITPKKIESSKPVGPLFKPLRKTIKYANRTLKYHPKMDLDYFKNIDTLSKAYWLGWLFAEGSLWKEGDKIRFGVEIGKDDEILIQKFAKAIGFNYIYIDYPKGQNTLRMRFVNRRFAENLMKHGFIVGKKKSNNIRLPKLKNRELYLAFLLGFFDGDGKKGSSQIISGSKEFLNDIKLNFNLEYKIGKKVSDSIFNGKRIQGSGYIFSLGAKLFNEMLDNYQDSLQVKRIRFKTEEERVRNIKANVWTTREKKFKVSREDLEDLVWKMSFSKIGKMYNVSANTVRKWAIRWGIALPPRGYWGRKENL